MGTLLVTVVYGKEGKARLEVLDCIFPFDSSASILEQPYGGLLLLETRLAANEAAMRLAGCSTSLIFKIIPIDAIVESDLGRISSEVLRLVPQDASGVAVDCIRRGRSLPSSSYVEEEVGRLLKGRGNAIDLENPALVVRIDIIGDRSTISVRPPSGFISKRGGTADG